MAIRQSSRTLARQVGFAGSDSFVYEDIQASAGQIIRPGPVDPTWRTFNYGVGAGVAFSALGFAINDYVDYSVQTAHAMKLNTVMDIHIHYTLPSDSASDRIKFQVDVVAAGINVYYAVPAGSPFSVEYVLDGTEAGKHKLLEIADVPAANTTVSSMYICRLTRIAASADDFAPEVYITYVDCHYQKDTLGSLHEDSKV